MIKRTFKDALEQTTKLTDALGAPMDEGIRHAVASLWCSGITTFASCEGHRKGDAPWIDVARKAVSKLIPLLRRFYACRDTPFHRRLILVPFQGGAARLESQGAFLWRQKDLRGYKKEMRDFSRFLRGEE